MGRILVRGEPGNGIVDEVAPIEVSILQAYRSSSSSSSGGDSILNEVAPVLVSTAAHVVNYMPDGGATHSAEEQWQQQQQSNGIVTLVVPVEGELTVQLDVIKRHYPQC
jgi:hypothetical protein